MKMIKYCLKNYIISWIVLKKQSYLQLSTLIFLELYFHFYIFVRNISIYILSLLKIKHVFLRSSFNVLFCLMLLHSFKKCIMEHHLEDFIVFLYHGSENLYVLLLWLVTFWLFWEIQIKASHLNFAVHLVLIFYRII